MHSKNDNKKILLDCDVIRHLLKGDRISLLRDLYGNNITILKVVFDELFRSTQIQNVVENFIKFYSVEIMEFPADNFDILKEYAALRKRFGDGESACMAVAKFTKDYIASSNLKDIKDYCENNGIIYLTTMDILLEAVDAGLITESDCDLIIQKIKRKKSKLPVDNLADYRASCKTRLV